ncbi:low molecular weight phosphotyrosine protein phosphatase [Paraburkholderia sp. MMS20-SJTR3]|uniref:protein-tyrosine-phosphatase n=1 Tax=Paraburkholderia sejongensis TaxID=2886946 RepID=A0ABS8JY56_9BURK|nr:low molecular weight protein-tyrosine-phosphatase [Paraburkholderia sp. MMS20-SJTR3]MCC8394825.1 low molecular weight phosphotyrosine protein phosphatase [Paraburkholderia sp. MMS20-SJTR3]
MIGRVLVVCVGNICRSPMAQALLAQRLEAVAVESAGIGALHGEGADPLAVQLMRERGLDLDAHRARQLTALIAAAADLVLVMDHAQKHYVERRFPALYGRVYLLGSSHGAGGPPDARFEIPDPHRKGLASFEQSLALIDAGVDAWCARIAGVTARAGAGTAALSTDHSSS